MFTENNTRGVEWTVFCGTKKKEIRFLSVEERLLLIRNWDCEIQFQFHSSDFASLFFSFVVEGFLFYCSIIIWVVFSLTNTVWNKEI